MPDAKLQLAMEEIKAVLRKHDIAAMVGLQSATHSEYLYELSPSWSCISLEHNSVRIRAKVKSGGSEEKERLRVTAGMICGFHDLATMNLRNMADVMKCLGQHVEIQHWSREE